MNFLPNVNTADLLSMLADSGSLTDVFPSSFSIDENAELEILEQPKQRGFRFRYSCEGPSHGGLPGERSAKGRKTFPSVQINNYHGKARIEVTLVTVSDPPMPHAHSLVGKNVTDGACVVEVSPDCGMTASFPNLGIQHVTKKNVKSVLKDRYLKKHRLESSFTSGQPMNVDLGNHAGPSSEEALTRAITDAEMAKIDQTVEQEAKVMNLSTVRLCFQTYLPNEQGHFVNCLKPVYSHAIFDSKAAAASELKICRIDKQAGSVQGGDEVFLLCDKVQKEDIEVRFYENPEDEQQTAWEDFGKFSTSDVHRQFAIVFKTPGYWNTAIEKPVQVLLELRRKSDKERSPAIAFTYKPQEFDSEQIGAKRRKRVHHFGEQLEQASSSSMQQDNDPGAGPSGVDTLGAAGFPTLNPFMASPWLHGMPIPGLFGLPNIGSLGAGGFGSVGSDGGQIQYQTPDQEPSASNLS